VNAETVEIPTTARVANTFVIWIVAPGGLVLKMELG
jgi:hypothetical protein